MNSLAIIGCTLVGAGIGALVGLWYGMEADHSDFPIYAAFTGPAGALVGGLAGVIVGSAIFA